MTPAKSRYSFLGVWKLTAFESSHSALPHPQQWELLAPGGVITWKVTYIASDPRR